MSGYIGSLPTPVATQSRDDFTATSGQTTFVSSGYTAGYIDIYLNGVHLKDGTDYTATNGTDVVLTVAAVLNDIIELVAFDTFDVIANTVTGNLAVSGTVDGRDVAADGSTLDSAVDAIALNTAKTGITSGQASAITANTAKTGITSGQASAITANTAKVTNVAHPLVEKAVPSNAVFTDTNTTYSVGDGGLTQNNFTDADHTKLNAIESSATADQTKSDIEGLGIDVPATNLTGTIAAARLSTATTQAESDDSTKIATTAYVVDKITTLIGGAPSTLNDLNELAAAINDDASYNSTLTTALATKLPLSGGTMTGNIAHGGDFTLDVTGNLTLDAGGGDIFLKQNGVHYGSIKRNNGDLQIHSEASDEDILFVGNDGGSAITALTLDMSNKGSATFNTDASVTLQGVHNEGGGQLFLKGTDTPAASKNLGQVNFGNSDDHSLAMIRGESTAATAADLVFQTEATGAAIEERMRIKDNGKVGIGTNDPNRKLHVSSGGTISSGNAYDVAIFQNSDAAGIRLVDAGNGGSNGGNAGLGNDNGNLNVASAGVLSFSTNLTANAPLYNGSSSSTGGTERMRIDTSGNVMVGHTSTHSPITNGGSGVSLMANGQLFAGGEYASVFNREDSDGDIITFRKDGSAVGSISAFYGNVMIGKASGARIAFDGTLIYSTNDAGSTVDGSYDLGNSGSRFKEVHAVTYHGSGANLTGVGGSTTRGDVGTYTIGCTTSFQANVTIARGATIAGNTIAQGNTHSFRLIPNREYHNQQITTQGLSGTWRNMGGDVRHSSVNDKPGTLWCRIS